VLSWRLGDEGRTSRWRPLVRDWRQAYALLEVASAIRDHTPAQK
jgi:hypothetical protein